MKAKEFIIETTTLSEFESGTDNSRQIFSKLKELGYTKLGSGQDATVWTKDESHVIKILMPSDKPYRAEQGFITFYEFCQSNPTNHNLPKFVNIGGKHHTVFSINGTNYRQIAMEKLSSIKSGSFEEFMVRIFSDVCTYKKNWRAAFEEISRPEFLKAWDDGISNYTDAINTIGDSVEYQNIFNTMRALYTLSKNTGLGWDLHAENVMQRNNGTLVIIDPFYS